MWAVVKANAYGHGIENAYAGLRAADGFALLDLDEAERLRALGWRGPVLLLEGCFEARDLELCSRLNLWHVIHRDEQIDWLAAHKTHQPQRVFLKMNSGMNRLGFAARGVPLRMGAAERAAAGRGDRLMTHFSDADGARGIVAQQAASSRPRATCPASVRCPTAPRRCARRARRGDADWVRAGIMGYGSAPDFPAHDIAHWGLQPAMTLRSRTDRGAGSLRRRHASATAAAFVAATPMRIGVAACGYADGYPRRAPSARRCWSTACARGSWAGCRWTW